MISESKAFLKALRWLINSFRSDDSYLRESGFVDSLKVGHPSDAEGRPLPWMNYSFITFIDSRLSGLTLFEYGSGYSTSYWASKCEKVYAVESDKKWCKKINKMSNTSNVNVNHVKNEGKYVKTIEGVLPNVLVIDGDYRKKCLIKGTKELPNTSVIIVDDSERKSLRGTLDIITSKDYSEIVFSGPKAGNINTFYTSVLYKE